jgi:hypothetical protein
MKLLKVKNTIGSEPVTSGKNKHKNISVCSSWNYSKTNWPLLGIVAVNCIYSCLGSETTAENRGCAGWSVLPHTSRPMMDEYGTLVEWLVA